MTAYRFGRCRLDTDTRELRVDGEPVHLEPQVFDVLAALLASRHRVVSKQELLETVWGSQFVTESAITSRIKSARSAIGDDGAAQLLIQTKRGSGYRFVGEVEVLNNEPPDGSRPRWRASRPLPPARVSLIGRADDLEIIGGLLRRHRLVTITGPGGVGKSSLALDLAREHRDGVGHDGPKGGHRERGHNDHGHNDHGHNDHGHHDHSDEDRGHHERDVAFVELAPVRQGTDVVRAVAEATGIEGAGAQDLAALASGLSSRQLLVVLDNCEHLLDATAELVHAVLDAGSGPGFLATSREALGVDGEAVRSLGSLGRDAAILFVDRAAAATGASPYAADDPTIMEICDRLDGLPLAIELAAAQMRHLTPAELIGRLDDRLGILIGSRPRAGERHLTLAATIEWSYKLLSVQSRDFFDLTGVFPASFDLDAAAAVSGLDAVAATNAIGDLVAKNLVVHDRGSGRYRMLETIRLFARSRLDASGHAAAVTERLRRHVVARVRARPRPQAWISASLAAHNRDDIENVRVAFDASLGRDEHGDALDIAIGLSSLWRNAASYAEGLRWVSGLSQRDLEPRDRLWLHLVRADLGLGSGDPWLMLDAASAAVELGDEDPAAAVIASIYRSLLWMAVDPAETVAGLATARDRARQIGEPPLERLARAFRMMAIVASVGMADPEAEARELTIPATDGYDYYIAIWAAWGAALADRDGPRLRHWMDRQLDNQRDSGLPENWLMMFCHALTAMAEGSDFLPHLTLARQRAAAEGRRADVDCVLALAYAAACRDEPVRAAELIGASSGALFHDTGNFQHLVTIRDRVVRPRLDGDVFDQAVARGAEWPVDAVLAEYGL